MPAIYQETVTIPFYQTDFNGNLTLPALINYLIQASEQQAVNLGADSALLEKYNVGWVITQYEMTIKKMPKISDTITISTQATSYNKYFCYRDFWVHQNDQEACVHVKAVFVMMDFQTRKMVAVIPEIMAHFQSEQITKSQRFSKITKLDPKMAKQKLYHVRYFDIDTNRHVNNVHYFEWLLDTLPADFLKQHQIKHVKIRYGHEVRYGQDVHSYLVSDHQENKIITRHKITTDHQDAADAEIIWQ